MEPTWTSKDGRAVLWLGDCLEVMSGMPDNSVDSIVTDPPYGLSFMGKRWDYDVPGVEVWAECLRVLKPGGHLLAFAGTRTQHRMCCRIEDAGFEIRDMIAWVYGQGFPKSLDVSKAIDAAAGAEREVIGVHKRHGGGTAESGSMAGPLGTASDLPLTAPATDSARQWDGWGTALKPALEPITLARKPLAGTVAANVLAHGCGALNVDGCRIGVDQITTHGGGRASTENWRMTEKIDAPHAGRWPANLIHDGSEEVLAGFPMTGGETKPRTLRRLKDTTGWSGGSQQTDDAGAVICDAGGSAARFFKECKQDCYCALCALPLNEKHSTMSAWKSAFASSAAKSGWTSLQITECIARLNALLSHAERIAPAVKSAGSLCDSCAISIAAALVATKTGGFSREELRAILASIGSSSSFIPLRNLASFAEIWANIDTIPTTGSLSLLFGSVHHAIASCTSSARLEAGAGDSGRELVTRFRYNAKADRDDRNDGCEAMPKRPLLWSSGEQNPGSFQAEGTDRTARNFHPTVKPTDLMRYLCRLVTPKGGTVLDVFCGSGSTGKAAVMEGFHFIGIDREADYIAIARARIERALCESADCLNFSPA
jgi:DNA modification methylase